jgi:hypothetical protein
MKKKIKRAMHLEAQEKKHAREMLVSEMQRRRQSGHPGGSGQTILAYGMNKNLKNLVNNGMGLRSRPMSAKPIRQNRNHDEY